MDEFMKSARENRAAKIKAQEERMMIPIHTPHEHDVLCGRGNRIANFPGNIHFRALVGCLRKDFVTSSTTTEKSLIIEEIFHQIKGRDPPGRFLRKKEKNCKVWYEIPDKGRRSAPYKIGQALRERIAGANQGKPEDSSEESVFSLGGINVSGDNEPTLHAAQQDDNRRPKNKATMAMTTTKSSAALIVESSKLDVTTPTDISLSDPDDMEVFTVGKQASLNVTFESLLQEATVLATEQATSERPIYNRKVSNGDEMTRSEQEVSPPPLYPPIPGTSNGASGAANAEDSNNDSLSFVLPLNIEDFEVSYSSSSSKTSLDDIKSILKCFEE